MTYRLTNGNNTRGVKNEKIYINIQPKPREIDRIHQQILCEPRVEDHKHSKR